MNQSIFYLLAFLTVLFALMVVLAKNPVHSALYMVMAFFSITCHYILLNAQFLAIVNFIVYMGAIMVLIIFAIMFLNLSKETEPEKSTLLKFAAAIGAGLLLVTMVGAFRQVGTAALPFSGDPALSYTLSNPDMGLVKNLGRVLFKDFLLPFELASILLLSAMVGAILLAKKELN